MAPCLSSSRTRSTLPVRQALEWVDARQRHVLEGDPPVQEVQRIAAIRTRVEHGLGMGAEMSETFFCFDHVAIETGVEQF